MKLLSAIRSLFPYSFPSLVMLWTFLIFFQQDNRSHGLVMALVNNTLFIILFASLACYYYGSAPKTRTDKARAIAFNVAVLPLLFINIAFMPTVMAGKDIGSSGMAYLIPMIYSPIIFVVVWAISYLFIREG